MILLAAVLVGMETCQTIAVPHGELLHLQNEIMLWIFVVEAVLEMAQHGENFYFYFSDLWNLFDFSIVLENLPPTEFGRRATSARARQTGTSRLP